MCQVSSNFVFPLNEILKELEIQLVDLTVATIIKPQYLPRFQSHSLLIECTDKTLSADDNDLRNLHSDYHERER